MTGAPLEQDALVEYLMTRYDTPMATFKLFVVGEASPDPDHWNSYRRTAIVIAESEDQARALCPMLSETVTEIPIDRAIVLHVMSGEP
jgi:hypothetical protein